MEELRVHCEDCRLYRPKSGICGAAVLGKRRDVWEKYGPVLHPLRMCEFYEPKPTDPDQRSGRERYPTMWAEYQAKYGEQKQTTPRERFLNAKAGLSA